MLRGKGQQKREIIETNDLSNFCVRRKLNFVSCRKIILNATSNFNNTIRSTHKKCRIFSVKAKINDLRVNGLFQYRFAVKRRKRRIKIDQVEVQKRVFLRLGLFLDLNNKLFLITPHFYNHKIRVCVID